MAQQTLMSQVKSVVSNHNASPVRVMALIPLCVDHMFQHNDWTQLAWLIAKLEPSADASLVRSILGKVTAGISKKDDKDQPSGIRINMKANAGVTEKMPVLRALVAEGVSLRSKRVREEILGKVDNPFDFHKWTQRVLKKMDDEGFSFEDFLKEANLIEKEASVIDVTKPEHMDDKIKPMAA